MKLEESCKDMEKNQKLFADKANEKYKVLKEGMEKLMKRDWFVCELLFSMICLL